MNGKWIAWPLALACLLAAPQAAARNERVALTFDDLPCLTQLQSPAYVTYVNVALLRGLKRHHFPATGFVNEGKFGAEQQPQMARILEMWLDAGMSLGNHTFSHGSVNDMSVEAYATDITNGEAVLRPLLAKHHQKLQWFRHPYLETGSSRGVRQELDQWLSIHAYRIAPVTMQNSDWLFSEPYDDALARHDDARAASIKASYLDYTARMIGWYRTAGQQLFERQISYVMLLHASRLNADSIDDFAAILKANNLRPVKLGQAMRDPVYNHEDHFVGKDGPDWLTRWAPELHKSLPLDSRPVLPANIVEEYRRVDNDY